MNKEFENVLDDCLERLIVRGETIEDCLNAYPQRADTLKSLLQTALLTKNAAGIEPSPRFRASARYQFRIALQKAASSKGSFLSVWRFRLATALTTIIVMLMAGGGLVVATGNSMPDSPFYSVKLAVEQMQLNLTFSELDKARLISEFTGRRVSEIIHMAQKGDNDRVIAGTNLLNNQLEMIVGLTDYTNNLWLDGSAIKESGQMVPGTDRPLTTTTGLIMPPPLVTSLPPSPSTDAVFQSPLAEENEAPSLLTILLQDGIDNSNALRDSLSTVPESTQPALLEAIAVLEEYYDAISGTGD